LEGLLTGIYHNNNHNQVAVITQTNLLVKTLVVTGITVVAIAAHNKTGIIVREIVFTKDKQHMMKITIYVSA